MNLDDALNAHSQWKIKLRTAILKKETLDVKSVSADTCCELGKWLHNEAKIKFSKLRCYTDLVEKHAAFHKQAGRVALAINEKKFEEATALLGAGTQYMSASSAVGIAISTLKNEAKL